MLWILLPAHIIAVNPSPITAVNPSPSTHHCCESFSHHILLWILFPSHITAVNLLLSHVKALWIHLPSHVKALWINLPSCTKALWIHLPSQVKALWIHLPSQITDLNPDQVEDLSMFPLVKRMIIFLRFFSLCINKSYDTWIDEGNRENLLNVYFCCCLPWHLLWCYIWPVLLWPTLVLTGHISFITYITLLDQESCSICFTYSHFAYISTPVDQPQEELNSVVHTSESVTTMGKTCGICQGTVCLSFNSQLSSRYACELNDKHTVPWQIPQVLPSVVQCTNSGLWLNIIGFHISKSSSTRSRRRSKYSLQGRSRFCVAMFVRAGV